MDVYCRSGFFSISRYSFLCCLVLASCAAPQVRDDSLYRALEGQSGIARLVDAMVKNLYADPRIEKLFRRDEDAYFRERLCEQLCQLSGGGCEYTGLSMAEAHDGLNLHEAEFNAFVEDARTAMTEIGIRISTQNRLLALLAPMHQDVIAK
jgi:hemoglobin